MKQSLRVSVGAVILALTTIAAFIFALLNFQQRRLFEYPDDGVTWIDTARGVEARSVLPNSPATHAGVRQGDILVAINDLHISRATDVSRRLWRAGLWSQVHYRLSRSAEEFETSVVVVPNPKPTN